MKTTFKTQTLLAHLKAFAPKNAVLPILEYVRFRVNDGVIVFTTTDLSNNLISSTPCVGDMPDGTAFCVDHKMLSTYLATGKQSQITIELIVTKKKSVDKDTKIETEYNEYSVCIDNNYTLMSPDSDEFPHDIEVEPTMIKTFSPALYHEFNQAKDFCGRDDLRVDMMGICVTNKYEGQYQLCATDAHKLYKVVFGARPEDDKEDFELIIGSHKLLCNAAAKFKTETQNVVLAWNDKNIVFTTSEFTLISRLIEGKYPNYNAVIPQGPAKAKKGEEQQPGNRFDLMVSKTELAAAINKVKIAASRTTNQIKFTIKGNVLDVFAEDLDFSTSMRTQIVCSTSKPKDGFEIAFNATFLLSCIARVLSDDCVFTMEAPNRAAVIKSGHRLMLAMPVMLNN